VYKSEVTKVYNQKLQWKMIHVDTETFADDDDHTNLVF